MSIQLTNSAVRKLEGGALWFSIKDVVGRKPALAGIVDLIDGKKRHIGMAFLSPGSQYYLRAFKDAKWKQKLAKAYARRGELSKLTNAFRVVHAESDGIPSVVIDKYNDIWSFQITSAGAETIKHELIDIIVQEYKPAAIIEKNNIEIRKKEGLPLIEKVVYQRGDASPCVTSPAMSEKEKRPLSAEIKEGDETFEVDVLNGQKTGAYLDYRAFRLKARELITPSPLEGEGGGEGAGVHCLDAFSYEGWFACQIAANAKRVVAVDASERACRAARSNAERNGHKNIEVIKADVFEYLKTSKEKFDFIHLDPPSFSKGYGALEGAKRGYKKLLSAAFPLLNQGGILMISSCSHAVTERVLEELVKDSAVTAGFEMEIIYRGIQDKDHPQLKSFPKSLYLKAIAIRVKKTGNFF